VKELNYVCLPNDTSYGLTAFETCRALTNLGVKVNLFPINEYGLGASPEDHDFLFSLLKNAESFNVGAPSLRLWHAFDMALHAGAGNRFGWTIFELDQFSPRELAHLRSQDMVIVCSEWARQVCLANKINAKVARLGVDHKVFHPGLKTGNFPRKFRDSTVFINVGKMELRKHDIILECFESAFADGENVELHMVWDNRLLDQRAPQEKASWLKAYRTSKLADRITLYDWLPSQNDVAKLIANADCGVFPSHAEGFNLGLLQTLACGTLAIATDYSAHTEFCTVGNTMLIDVLDTEEAYDGVWFKGGAGNWAKFGVAENEQLINYMRYVHQQKQSGANMVNDIGAEDAKQFTWENTAKKLMEIINEN